MRTRIWPYPEPLPPGKYRTSWQYGCWNPFATIWYPFMLRAWFLWCWDYRWLLVEQVRTPKLGTHQLYNLSLAWTSESGRWIPHSFSLSVQHQLLSMNALSFILSHYLISIRCLHTHSRCSLERVAGCPRRAWSQDKDRPTSNFDGSAHRSFQRLLYLGREFGVVIF